MEYFAGSYDVIVIGAGHAGIEACLAAARLGVKTAVFTINLDWVGNMPCNPSIGGPAKGHLVRELDALGGQMGISADLACIQMRLLNTGKGYAVHALRGQEDKPYYHTLMKKIVENQETCRSQGCLHACMTCADNNYIKGICYIAHHLTPYLPMQKREKISLMISSCTVSPVISPKSSIAVRTSITMQS